MVKNMRREKRQDIVLFVVLVATSGGFFSTAEGAGVWKEFGLTLC